MNVGQDGSIVPKIDMISSRPTYGAPRAFPSATVISEVTFVRCPGQVRHVRTQGHSLDGEWEMLPTWSIR